MTRLVLIADLHFGKEDLQLLPELIAAINAAEPDLVVVAGDFVQRARASHFRPARDFMNLVEAPWLAVPGNHDLPLFNLPARLFRPRAAYRHWIDLQTEPLWDAPDLRLIGLDTTDRFSHQRGRVTDSQIDRVQGLISTADGRLPVILAHHPFHQAPEVEKKLMRGAGKALSEWSSAHNHVLLTGHLHNFLVEPLVAREGDGRTLQVHCGTSASRRRRGAPNDFCILDIDGDTISVVQSVHVDGNHFEARPPVRFEQARSGWERVRG